MTDIRKPEDGLVGKSPFFYADVLDRTLLEKIVVENRIDWIIHFSALLSAIGEKMVEKALDVNINGFQNVMELGEDLVSLNRREGSWILTDFSLFFLLLNSQDPQSPRVLPQHHWCLWAHDSAREHPRSHHHEAYHHLRYHQGPHGAPRRSMALFIFYFLFFISSFLKFHPNFLLTL